MNFMKRVGLPVVKTVRWILWIGKDEPFPYRMDWFSMILRRKLVLVLNYVKIYGLPFRLVPNWL